MLAGVFCVNVLRDDQARISDNFAGRSAARGAATRSSRRIDVEVALLYDFSLSNTMNITPLAELSPNVLLR